MKCTKIVHNEEQCVEYVTKYMGHEAADSPHNTIYKLSGISPDANSHNLIVYVDNIKRYENSNDNTKDYQILDKKTIKLNYQIKEDSNIRLIVTRKIESISEKMAPK